MTDKVTIGGKEYEITPLRMKHLKQITKLISEPAPTAIYDNLSRFFPYMLVSIKEMNPTFTEDMLEDGTLTEITEAWSKIIDCSGIKIVPKAVGETKPANGSSTGQKFMDEQPVQPAGVIG